MKTFGVSTKGNWRCDHELNKDSRKMKIGDVATCKRCGKEFERVS